MFTIWFKRMFRQKVDIEEYDKITNLVEVKNMLTAIADEIMQKGIGKGKLEERRALAKKMKDLDYSIDEIAKITGLSTEEIERL